MIPYSDFTFFGLLLYAVVPTLILGLFGRAGWRWALFVTAVMLVLQYHGLLNIRSDVSVREIWIVGGVSPSLIGRAELSGLAVDIGQGLGVVRAEHAAAAEALNERWAERLSLARVG